MALQTQYGVYYTLGQDIWFCTGPACNRRQLNNLCGLTDPCIHCQNSLYVCSPATPANRRLEAFEIGTCPNFSALAAVISVRSETGVYTRNHSPVYHCRFKQKTFQTFCVTHKKFYPVINHILRPLPLYWTNFNWKTIHIICDLDLESSFCKDNCCTQKIVAKTRWTILTSN